MAWQDEQPPWGGGKKPSSPEDFIAELLKKLKQGFGGGGKSDIPGEEDGQGPTGPSPGFMGGMGKILIVIGSLCFVGKGLKHFLYGAKLPSFSNHILTGL